MSLPFSLFLALKYLKPKRSYFSVITIISVLGVMLGVAVLVIVLSVMSGFDDMWREKILDFDAHLTVMAREPIAEPGPVAAAIGRIHGVRGVGPFIQGPVVVQQDNQIYTPILRGVDPARERTVSRIPDAIVYGAFDLTDGGVVIGADLAARMRVVVGDTILVNSPRSFMARDEIRLPEEYTVRGIFQVGMWEYDSGFILCGLETARDLFELDAGAQALKVMIDDPYQAPAAARRIETILGPRYSARTWMEQNQQLFGALRVEKNMMFFLLIFITIVAAFGITNTLITVTVNKTREIGLLKSVGFQSASIMRIFLWLGWIEGMVGTTAGILSGLVVLRYRNDLMRWLSDTFSMELFPKELYHLSEIPARTAVSDVAIVAIAVIAICTLAGLIPAYRAARMDPVQALRHE